MLLKKTYKKNFFSLIYLLVNLLFLYKYGLRQNLISVNLLILIYSISCIGFFITNPIDYFLKTESRKAKSYLILCSVGTLIIFCLTYLIDGTKLNVDRWSAMDVGIKALLNGEYPYTATDHLNGRTSNFPGLFIIGLPFYLMGNVGYLQVFSFVLLSFTLYNILKIKQTLNYIILLLLSPAFWWEIFAISDLLSNVIIVFCFVLLIKDKFKDNVLKKPVFMGLSTSFLTLTRGIVAIPLILLVFRDFITINIRDKIKYVISFILLSILLIALVIINCPDLETLKKFNPLNLQTMYLPNYINIFAVLLPFYFSLKIKKFNNQYFQFCTYLLLFPPFLSFSITMYYMGFDTIIIDNKFDLSYLSIAFPFLIMEIVKDSSKKID